LEIFDQYEKSSSSKSKDNNSNYMAVVTLMKSSSANFDYANSTLKDSTPQLPNSTLKNSTEKYANFPHVNNSATRT
jgi:hypothetical protein